MNSESKNPKKYSRDDEGCGKDMTDDIYYASGDSFTIPIKIQVALEIVKNLRPGVTQEMFELYKSATKVISDYLK